MEFKRFDIVRTKDNVVLDDLYLRGGMEFTVVRYVENTICCIAEGEDKMQYFRPEQLELVSRANSPIREFNGFTEDEVWHFLEPKVKDFIDETHIRPAEREMLIAIYRAGYNRGRKNKPFVGGNVKESNHV
nr:MAG TPA: hypothetical protein [Caudoviricetes sp.]